MLMNTKDMHEAIGYLYSHVFRFLWSAMKWYQDRASKKVLNSLKQDMADEMRDQIVKIKGICDSICKDSLFKTQAEVRDLRLHFEHLAEQDRKARDRERQATFEDQRPPAKREAVAEDLMISLQATQKAWLHEDDKPSTKAPVSGKQLVLECCTSSSKCRNYYPATNGRS